MPESSLITADFTDLRTERAVVSALTAYPALFAEVAERLPVAAFSDPETRTAFAGIVEASLADKNPASLPHAWPASTDVPRDTHTLYDLLQRRRLRALMLETAQQLYSPQAGPLDVIGGLEAGLAELQQDNRSRSQTMIGSAASVLPGLIDTWRERARTLAESRHGITGISTGFRRVDSLLNGLNPGLYVVGGAPKTGKTTWVNQVCLNVAMAGIPVLYVTFENSRTQLIEKLLARRCGSVLTDVARGQVKPDVLQQTVEWFCEGPGQRLFYLEADSSVDVCRVKTAAQQAMAQTNAQQCVIVIDFLQKMAPVMGGQSLRDNVSRLATDLRQKLARDLGSPVICITSLGRQAYRNDDSSPGLADCKESGDIEYSCDLLAFLAPDKSSDAAYALPGWKPVRFEVAANRDGDTGSISLQFDRYRARFAEVEPAGGRER